MIDKREPWSKFYWADWRANKELRLCSLTARGLWMEMLCLMHEATPYGHLLISGKAPTEQQLAIQAGAPLSVVRKALCELQAAGVGDICDGVWVSRRMVRDAHRRSINQANGASGGNPRLMDKGSDNPPPTKPDKPQDKSRDARDPESRNQTPERDLKNQSLGSGSGRSALPRVGRLAGKVGIDWQAIATRMQSHGFDHEGAWTLLLVFNDRPEYGRRVQGAMRAAESKGTIAYQALVSIAREAEAEGRRTA